MLASLGLRREEGGLGKFSDVRGSVVTHWGVSEELTLGSGVSLDRGVQGVGELYFQPNGILLEAAISVRTGAEWDLLSNINWHPTNNLKFGWNIDKLSHRVKGDWKVSPQFAVTSTYDSRDALGIGFDYQTRSAANSTSLQASFDTNSRLLWRAGQQVGQWELQHQSNEVGTISHLTYTLDRQSISGNAIELSYQNRPTIKDNRISLRVAPGKYRIDFDPSGFPINWRTQAAGYAVEVAAGSYTKVLVPFIPSYTIEGVVIDRSGKPQTGAKVELIPTTGGESTFSITSRDGQFYLEALSQGSYRVQVNGKSIPGSIVNLTSSSESSQVLNLKTD